MDDEKIVVVCKSTKTKCDKDCQLWDGFGGECKMADVISGYIHAGDVVIIEIKRGERNADIEAENREYNDLTRITRIENK